MEKEELLKIKEAADSGDANACCELVKIVIDSEEEPVEKYKLALDYYEKAFDIIIKDNNCISDDNRKELWSNWYLIYSNYSHYGTTRRDCNERYKYYMLKGYWYFSRKDFENNNYLINELYDLMKNRKILPTDVEFYIWTIGQESADLITRIKCCNKVSEYNNQNDDLYGYFDYLHKCCKLIESSDYMRIIDFGYDEVNFFCKMYCELARCYYSGKGTGIDYEKSLFYYLKADENVNYKVFNEDDYYNIATIYKYKLDKKDYVKAYYYFSKCSKETALLERAKMIFYNEFDFSFDPIEASRILSNESKDKLSIDTDIIRLKKIDFHLDINELYNYYKDYLDLILHNEISRIVENIERTTELKIREEVCKKLKDIRIDYSYEKKVEDTKIDIYDVSLSIDELLDELNKYKEELDRDNDSKLISKIEELINIIKSIKEYILVDNIDKDIVSNYISNILQVQSYFEGIKKIYGKISKLNNKLKIQSHIVLGEYCNTTLSIKLYLYNIYDVSKDKKTAIIRFLSTFAHELFHAYHALIITSNEKKLENYNKSSNIVEESLANYFEYSYANYAKLKISNYDTKLPNRIKDYDTLKESIMVCDDMYCNPYAGALYFYPCEIKWGDITGKTTFGANIFKKVFNLSLKSFDEAFKVLKLLYDMDND